MGVNHRLGVVPKRWETPCLIYFCMFFLFLLYFDRKYFKKRAKQPLPGLNKQHPSLDFSISQNTSKRVKLGFGLQSNTNPRVEYIIVTSLTLYKTGTISFNDRSVD